MIKSNIILGLLILTGFFQVQAQTFKEVLKQSSEAYQQARFINAEVTATVFSEGQPRVIENKYYKRGELYSIESLGMHIIRSEDFVLSINKEDKTIHYMDLDLSQKDALKQQDLLDLDSLYESVKNVKLIESTEDLYMFLIESKNEAINSTKLYIDKHSSFIKKIEYSYNEELFGKMKVLVDYTYFEKPYPVSVFKKDTYILFKKGTYIPVATFKNFKVVTDQ